MLPAIIANWLGLNWKRLVKEQGVPFAVNKISHALNKVFKREMDETAREMEEQGWTWDGPGGKDTDDEGLGRGFVLARDAQYRLLDNAGLKGGPLKDGIRDGTDNACWEKIRAKVTPDVTTPAELVALVEPAFVEVIGEQIKHAADGL
jgi:hypothetical protein